MAAHRKPRRVWRRVVAVVLDYAPLTLGYPAVVLIGVVLTVVTA